MQIDLRSERIPGELHDSRERRVAPALQAPSIIHFQRLDARPVLDRRRQLIHHAAAAAADRRPLLGNRLTAAGGSDGWRRLPNARPPPPTDGKRQKHNMQ